MKRKSGFTIVEICIVVVILTLLAVIAWPEVTLRSDALEQLKSEGVENITDVILYERVDKIKIQRKKEKIEKKVDKKERAIKTEFESDFLSWK